MRELTAEILDALALPFDEGDIEFLPRAASNGKALALAYVDARAVMRRLDSVVPADWSFDFDVLSGDGKMVRGRLTVCGVTRCDAGEASGEEEPLKSAVSDALKRAAVHFGIGRYLYNLPKVWAGYDPQKKRWTETPRFDPRDVRRACGQPATRERVEVSGPEPAPERFANPSGPMLTGRSVPPAQAESSGDRGALLPNGSPREQVASGAFDTSPPEGVKAQPGVLSCSEPECGKVLTRGQHDVSLRAFGQPLCPEHQKLRREVVQR